MNEKAMLTGNQALVLGAIGERTAANGKWTDISRIKSNVLKELEAEAYITVDAKRGEARITALGILALENHVVVGSPEYARVKAGNAAPDTGLSVEIPPPTKPYAGVMGKSSEQPVGKPLNRIVAELAEELTRKPETAAKPESTEPAEPTEISTALPCERTGCFAPRTVSKSGRPQRYCATHHQERMAEQAEKARAGKAKKSRNRVGPAMDAHPTVVTGPDELTVEFTEAAVDVPATQSACDACTDCIHREVLDMLRAKYPKVDDLTRAVEAVRDLKNSLGIQ